MCHAIIPQNRLLFLFPKTVYRASKLQVIQVDEDFPWSGAKRHAASHRYLEPFEGSIKINTLLMSVPRFNSLIQMLWVCSVLAFVQKLDKSWKFSTLILKHKKQSSPSFQQPASVYHPGTKHSIFIKTGMGYWENMNVLVCAQWYHLGTRIAY